MSKDIKLPSGIIAQYRQHMGFFKAIKREAELASKKIMYNPFHLDMFEGDPGVHGGIVEYHENSVAEIPGPINNAQHETLCALGDVAKELGFEVRLGEMCHIPDQSAEMSIPLYMSPQGREKIPVPAKEARPHRNGEHDV